MPDDDEILKQILNSARSGGGPTEAEDELDKTGNLSSTLNNALNPTPGMPRAASPPKPDQFKQVPFTEEDANRQYPVQMPVPTMAKPPPGAFKGQPRPQYKDYGEDRNSDFTRDLQSFKKYGAYGLPAKKAWTMGEIMKMRDAVIKGASAKDIKQMFPDRTEAAIRYQVKTTLGGFTKKGPPDLGGQSGRRLREQRQKDSDVKLLQDYMERLKKQTGDQTLNIHPSILEMMA